MVHKEKSYALMLAQGIRKLLNMITDLSQEKQHSCCIVVVQSIDYLIKEETSIHVLFELLQMTILYAPESMLVKIGQLFTQCEQLKQKVIINN